MKNRKNDTQKNGNSSNLGDIVEAAVLETRAFFTENGVQLNSKQEAKIIRYLVRQIEESGSISEDAKRRIFDAII